MTDRHLVAVGAQHAAQGRVARVRLAVGDVVGARRPAGGDESRVGEVLDRRQAQPYVRSGQQQTAGP
ncbi:hypothetical protein, partial [Streptomyces alboverticillatus]|uniref:hypothetical protein n=1 Tax=Streptomyces alboverticillatus TaxID=173770 RepID=UPI00117C8E4A